MTIEGNHCGLQALRVRNLADSGDDCAMTAMNAVKSSDRHSGSRRGAGKRRVVVEHLHNKRER